MASGAATNAADSLRYGQPPRTVLAWGVPTVVIALGLVPLGATQPAAVVLGLAVGLLILVTTYVEIKVRRPHALPPLASS